MSHAYDDLGIALDKAYGLVLQQESKARSHGERLMIELLQAAIGTAQDQCVACREQYDKFNLNQ
jgi:hypothetical protein